MGSLLSAWLETMGPQMRDDVDGRRGELDRETMEAGLNNAVKDNDSRFPPEWRLSRSGRRPKDDVVDISLVAVMGGLCMLNGSGNALNLGTECKPSNVPLGATSLKLHDAVDQAAVSLLPGFPYLNTPLPGTR